MLRAKLLETVRCLHAETFDVICFYEQKNWKEISKILGKVALAAFVAGFCFWPQFNYELPPPPNPVVITTPASYVFKFYTSQDVLSAQDVKTIMYCVDTSSTKTREHFSSPARLPWERAPLIKYAKFVSKIILEA